MPFPPILYQEEEEDQYHQYKQQAISSCIIIISFLFFLSLYLYICLTAVSMAMEEVSIVSMEGEGGVIPAWHRVELVDTLRVCYADGNTRNSSTRDVMVVIVRVRVTTIHD
jgi:hypothetical protein